MANKSRNRRHQPPTGEGKRQSPLRGEPRKLLKRSEVVQAQRHHPELNIGDADAEAAWSEGDVRPIDPGQRGKLDGLETAPHFRADARAHFIERFWEMYLAIAFVERRFPLVPGRGAGPEFSFTHGD